MATTAKRKPVSKKTTLFDKDAPPGIVDPKLLRELQKNFGFDGFKQNQGAIINSVLSGKDTFVIMPTGGGKSLCYQLPAMMSEGVAIIVISSDLPEVLALADRILVMREGRQMGIFDIANASPENVMALATGQTSMERKAS